MLLLRSLLLSVCLLATTAGSAAALRTTYVETLPTRFLDYVGRDAELDWYHRFQPLQGRVVSSILSVSLSVTLSDDTTCPQQWECLGDRLWGSEVAQLSVDGASWLSGSATSGLFDGDVSSVVDLMAHDGIVGVSAQSLRGDFDVLSSSLTVEYEYYVIGQTDPPDPEPSLPEPSAALLFSAGALLVAARLRTRPRSR